MVLYADDTNVLVLDKDFKSPELKITLVLKQMETWFSENELAVNTEKTSAMLFHPCLQGYIKNPIIKIQQCSYILYFKYKISGH
jgi:hypothetical protein